MASTIDRTDVTVNDDSGTPSAPVGDGTTVNNAWVQVFLDAIDDMFSGAGAYATFVFGGAVSAVSLTVSSALTAASLTVSGTITAVSAVISGGLTAGTVSTNAGASFGGSIGINGDVDAEGAIYERGRSTAMGEWIAVPYDAPDFDPIGWQVASGDLVDFRYTLVGKTMTLAFYIVNSSIITGGIHLQLRVPGAFICATQNTNAIIHVNNGAGDVPGLAVAQSGVDYILLTSTLGGGTFAAGTNNTLVRGQITFQVA